jgi:hypothetical protein
VRDANDLTSFMLSEIDSLLENSEGVISGLKTFEVQTKEDQGRMQGAHTALTSKIEEEGEQIAEYNRQLAAKREEIKRLQEGYEKGALQRFHCRNI